MGRATGDGVQCPHRVAGGAPLPDLRQVARDAEQAHQLALVGVGVKAGERVHRLAPHTQRGRLQQTAHQRGARRWMGEHGIALGGGGRAAGGVEVDLVDIERLALRCHARPSPAQRLHILAQRAVERGFGAVRCVLSVVKVRRYSNAFAVH